MKIHFEFTIDPGATGIYSFQNAEDILNYLTENAQARGCTLSGGFFIEKDEDKSDEQKDVKSV